MHRLATRTLVLATAAWIGGCASGQSTEGPLTSQAPVPCLGRDGAAELAGWKQVTMSRFTFCVPSDWRAAGSQGWRGDGASVTVTLNASSGERVPFVVRRMEGSAPMPGASAAERISDVEMVDGDRVNVVVIRNGSRSSVSAMFDDIRIRIEGEGRGAAGEAVLRQVYRSVRRIGTP